MGLAGVSWGRARLDKRWTLIDLNHLGGDQSFG